MFFIPKQDAIHSSIACDSIQCKLFLFFRHVRTANDIKFSLKTSNAFSSSFIRGPNSFFLVFEIGLERGDAVLAIFKTIRLRTLHSLRNMRSSVAIVGNLSSRIALAVWLVTVSQPSLMTWTNYSLQLVPKAYFLSFSAPPAFLRSVKTISDWAMCFYGQLKNLTILSKYNRANWDLTLDETISMTRCNLDEVLLKPNIILMIL